ncbi:BMC domain-containing protein [Vagococcus carniphilus]|uniref:BMC domain-containing protein n=1 Tax=Vagococcus carniphilus TaxID=218144 RepID=A0A430B6S6_9ENTE|nr:BMC domain-containing protein [Vagococcus carniphilus]MDT2814504.1 BMC domain-containing protein [Vagococcus carniphilus]MDT2830571.1 BMC domain-containing protein [Vagococcus carniphilus]MDT2832617.1 BMC domain-containing protein [Vagococcus carniphilus]MDT2839869.1 BMC domain-containing protein [Vagococcus carniphilus]MDT2849742.1 BMC domain-containing protein [Vagococcus carniphilus]
MNEKNRIIQESVPGRQITIAHIIANPDDRVYAKVGLHDYDKQALGILTITPGEAAIVASDVAVKAADVRVAFMDRFSGTLVIAGDVMAVEAAIEAVSDTLRNMLNVSTAKITKS